MAAITLQNEDGTWKYDTTVDDPLFATILGEMKTGGIEYVPKLVLEGATGEILGRDWHYVEEWKKRMVDGTRPQETIWKSKVEELTSIIDTPEGWESYVAVSTSLPLHVRLSHMHASREYMKKHPNMVTKIMGELDEYSRAIVRMIDGEQEDAMSYFIVPFVRNVQLQVPYKVTSFVLLDMIDWEAVRAELEVLLPTIESPSIDLLTRGGMLVGWSRIMAGEKGGIILSVLVPPREKMEPTDTTHLTSLYYKLLDSYGDEGEGLSIIGLGVGNLVLSNKVFAPSVMPLYPNPQPLGILLCQLVGYVNSQVIDKHLTESVDEAMRSAWASSDPQYLLPYHASIVENLAQKIGLCSLRYIHLSLPKAVKNRIQSTLFRQLIESLMKSISDHLNTGVEERVSSISLI